MKIGDRIEGITPGPFAGERGKVIEIEDNDLKLPDHFGKGDLITIQWEGGTAVTRTMTDHFKVISDASHT